MNTLRPKFLEDYTALEIQPILWRPFNLTSVLPQLLPPTTLFLPLLDRLTFASLLSQSPRSLARVGFRLLILLGVALVFGATLVTTFNGWGRAFE